MSLTDTLGSLAVATKGQYMTGVSVDIGTSFLKPAGRTGDTLNARASVTGLGDCRRVLFQVARVNLDRFRQAECLRSLESNSQTVQVTLWRMDVSVIQCPCV